MTGKSPRLLLEIDGAEKTGQSEKASMIALLPGIVCLLCVIVTTTAARTRDGERSFRSQNEESLARAPL